MKFMVSMNDDLKKKVDLTAEKMFMSRSGFVSMCVAKYFQEDDMVGVMKKMPELLGKIEELQKNGGNVDGLLQDFQGKQ